jgi:TonB-dependent SusC/RagA subfamily outer membrane receptor
MATWSQRSLLSIGCAVVLAGASACAPATGSPATPDSPGPSDRAITLDENDSANLSIEEFIQRRAPNVLVRRNGGNLSIQIRGQGTLGSQTNALVVIDGVMQDSPNALLTIKPIEIAKLEVLKDAAASRYGLHGANGVLVVTLRRDR